jgi:hypothetical protein
MFRHAGLDKPALACPVVNRGCLTRGHPGEVLDVLARIGSLRLPSVARLEFIPMKIAAGMTRLVSPSGMVETPRLEAKFFLG